MSGSITISPTQTAVFTALVAVLNTFGLAPANSAQSVVVIRGQVNRVPEPPGADYVVLWPLTRQRLATNIDQYGTATISRTEKLEVGIQADVHGPASADNATLISTLFRSQFAVDAFTAQGLPVAPLYADDPRQTAFENGEMQVEERWSVDLTMQVDVTVTSPQDFATTLTATAIDVQFEPIPLP
jgi:hypothetical protein